MKGEMPSLVLQDIMRVAHETWGDDQEMIEYEIEREIGCYWRFQSHDFRGAVAHKQRIIDIASQEHGWQIRLATLEEETNAFQELCSIKIDGVPEHEIVAFGKEAENESPRSFAEQLEHVLKKAKRFSYLKQLKETIGPIKGLLIRMESIVGNECYNGNIQNYESWGILESTGRTFRYPVTFNVSGKERKERTISSEIEEEVLITGSYTFGANELSVIVALAKIIRMIEQDYGVNLSDKNSNSSAQ